MYSSVPKYLTAKNISTQFISSDQMYHCLNPSQGWVKLKEWKCTNWANCFIQQFIRYQDLMTFLWDYYFTTKLKAPD